MTEELDLEIKDLKKQLKAGRARLRAYYESQEESLKTKDIIVDEYHASENDKSVARMEILQKYQDKPSSLFNFFKYGCTLSELKEYKPLLASKLKTIEKAYLKALDDYTIIITSQKLGLKYFYNDCNGLPRFQAVNDDDLVKWALEGVCSVNYELPEYEILLALGRALSVASLNYNSLEDLL